MFYITAISVIPVAFLAAFRTQCICFVVSMRGFWRLLGPRHSGFSRGPFLLRFWVLAVLAVFRKGLSVLFLA